MKTLTPPEVVQAILANKRVEIRGVIASQNDDWKPLDEYEIRIRVLTSGLFMFRLAQEMVTIGDVSFPKPESSPLELDAEYWIAEPNYTHYATTRSITWKGNSTDNMYLERGLVHLSRENAVAHAEALIKLSRGKFR